MSWLRQLSCMLLASIHPLTHHSGFYPCHSLKLPLLRLPLKKSVCPSVIISSFSPRGNHHPEFCGNNSLIMNICSIPKRYIVQFCLLLSFCVNGVILPDSYATCFFCSAFYLWDSAVQSVCYTIFHCKKMPQFIQSTFGHWVALVFAIATKLLGTFLNISPDACVQEFLGDISGSEIVRS